MMMLRVTMFVVLAAGISLAHHGSEAGVLDEHSFKSESPSGKAK
jgi:hypothetical protein